MKRVDPERLKRRAKPEGLKKRRRIMDAGIKGRSKGALGVGNKVCFVEL
jgi:hypothetical protein